MVLYEFEVIWSKSTQIKNIFNLQKAALRPIFIKKKETHGKK